MKLISFESQISIRGILLKLKFLMNFRFAIFSIWWTKTVHRNTSSCSSRLITKPGPHYTLLMTKQYQFRQTSSQIYIEKICTNIIDSVKLVLCFNQEVKNNKNENGKQKFMLYTSLHTNA